MKTFAISIPKPCHEDWNKMTPDTKGAFCASCQKSVYDFTDKSDEEIISVFEKTGKEKVCGRFAPAQLSRPVVSFGNESTTNRLAIFVCALLLVFGATLFNGTEAFSQNTKGGVKFEVMGKPSIQSIRSLTETVKDTTVKAQQIKKVSCGTKITEDDEIIRLGEVAIVKEPVTVLTGDTIIQEIPSNNIIDTIVRMEEPLDTVVVIDSVSTIEDVSYIAGGISFVEVVPDEPIQEFTPVEEIVEDSSVVENETVIIPADELEIKVSPNPSNGDIILSYNLETITSLKIDLFDISGKLIRTLAQQGKQYPGKYNVTYTIADLPNGVYNVLLLTAYGKASAKIILTK